MAKLPNYAASVELQGAVFPKNENDFPLMHAHYVQVDETGKRLDVVLNEIANNGGGGIPDIAYTQDSGVVELPDADKIRVVGTCSGWGASGGTVSLLLIDKDLIVVAERPLVTGGDSYVKNIDEAVTIPADAKYFVTSASTSVGQIYDDTNNHSYTCNFVVSFVKESGGGTGADGITPQLRIDWVTTMWEVSYDNGVSWTSLGVKATGEGVGSVEYRASGTDYEGRMCHYYEVVGTEGSIFGTLTITDGEDGFSPTVEVQTTGGIPDIKYTSETGIVELPDADKMRVTGSCSGYMSGSLTSLLLLDGSRVVVANHGLVDGGDSIVEDVNITIDIPAQAKYLVISEDMPVGSNYYEASAYYSCDLNIGFSSTNSKIEAITLVITDVNGTKSVDIPVGGGGNSPEIVQTAGGSTESVMSQRACSTAFASALKDFAEGNDVFIADISETPHGVAVTFWHKNLFNKATVLENTGINVNETGATYASDGKFVSDYIPVEAGKTYHLNWGDKRQYVVGFDSNKQYVAKLYSKYDTDAKADKFTVPVGMAYARIQSANETLDTLQLELGDTFTGYAPFTDAEEITVTTENGLGATGETKTIRKDETVEFNSIYPTMRIYAHGAENFKAKYNVDTSSMFANEGDAWED